MIDGAYLYTVTHGTAMAKAKKVHPALNVRLEPAVRAALDKAAKQDARTVSSLVQKVLAEWLRAEGFLK